MGKKFKYLVILMMVALFSIPTTVFGEDYFNEENVIKKIQDFYNVSYDMYLDMELKDFNSILDMNTIQNRNYVKAMEENADTWKYTLEKGYSKVKRVRYPMHFNFKSVNLGANEAVAIVDITGDQTDAYEAYPPFVVFGENKFELKLINGKWLIVNHDYEGYLFEWSKTKNIEKKPKNELFNKIDLEYKNVNETSLQNTTVTMRAYPYTDYSFSKTRAVNYANRFTVNSNFHPVLLQK